MGFAMAVAVNELSSNKDLSDLAEIAAGNVFYTLAEYAPTMLWMTDPDAALVYFNRTWLEFTGLPMDEVTGEGWLNCLHPDDREPCLEYALAQLERRERLRMEYRLRRHDGEYFQMLVLGEPHFRDDGEFLGYVGCTVDITAQVESQQQLRESNEALAKHSQNIALLNELNDNLQVCKNTDETKPILMRYGRKLFPDMAVTVSLYNESRNLVESFVSWGGADAGDDLLSPDDCWALRKSKPHCELGEDEIICPHFAACSNKRYVCVPMLAYGEVMGNLHLDLRHADNQRGGQSDEIKELLQLATVASDQIALALANLKLRATLQFQSTRDALTQLYNRRYVVEALEREVSRSVRSGKPVSMLMIDIDHFKRYNDTYGHDAGDHVLREFGAVLRHSVRGSDIAARYGGEEFAVILPESSGDEAAARAEQIRRKVAGMAVECRGEQLGQITISVGVAAYPENAETTDELFADADSALYTAKANGRNCVALAVPSEKKNQ